MGLKFILGRGGRGKSTYILSKVIKNIIWIRSNVLN